MSGRKGAVIAAAGALLVAAVAAGLCLGYSALGGPAALRVILAGDAEHPLYRILVHVRLPRVAGAVLAGSALAASGAVIQAVLGNPLASPNIIGVNAGAGLAVLLLSALLPGCAAPLPAAAFSGALLAALLVLAVSAGGPSRLTVVLAGFAVSAVFGAGMDAVLILYPDAYVGAGSFLAGGLAGLTAARLPVPAACIAAGLLLALCLCRTMNILSLGADTARALGMRVGAVRVLLLADAALLAGAAVCFAGLVGFVGLVAPHTARFLVGHDNRAVLPLSALLGAVLVTACDLLARVLFPPYELPVGIVLSAVGGPFFLGMILHGRRRLYG